VSRRALSVVVVLVGCGASDDRPAPDAPAPDAPTVVPCDLSDTVVTHPAMAPIAPHTECTVTTATVAIPSATHVENCSPIDYECSPPAGGSHYGSWAAYREYDAAIPWAFLVHNMEHGGVVLSYNCPSGCVAVVEALRAIRTDFAADRFCAPAVRNRLLIVPSPSLDVPIAVAAWGRSYTATCLDRPSLDAFVQESYAHGPEDTCAAGIDDATTRCP